MNAEFKVDYCPLRTAIQLAYRMPETDALNQLIASVSSIDLDWSKIQASAAQLIQATRADKAKLSIVESMLQHYSLSTKEGLALMGLAEALLRIPDKKTKDALIQAKLAADNWGDELALSHSKIVNATTSSLTIIGKLMQATGGSTSEVLLRSSRPLLRGAISQTIRVIGNHFVLGQNIEAAVTKAANNSKFLYSYDMLGEAAVTAKDALKYFSAYSYAIEHIGKSANNLGPIDGPGVSIKLSALHPRYNFTQKSRVVPELLTSIKALCLAAKKYNIGLTIDAEEADRLELSLDIIEGIFASGILQGWSGFGIAVQAYQKRAPYVIDWFCSLAKQYQQQVTVRLVKGAYWDHEIKDSQTKGLCDYPVYTRKSTTDLAYIKCAKQLLCEQEYVYPQFATHNALTIATLLELAKNCRFELQCLQGMATGIYDNLLNDSAIKCRIYAPVGTHKTLLAYLIRRLLENGANSSFISSLYASDVPISELIISPLKISQNLATASHPSVPLPSNLYAPIRANSNGFDIGCPIECRALVDLALPSSWGFICNSKNKAKVEVISPIDKSIKLGSIEYTNPIEIDGIIKDLATYAKTWQSTAVTKRACYLTNLAKLLQTNQSQLLSLLVFEAGKTFIDALDEIREAIDFCNYYAKEAIRVMQPTLLTSPTGESNQLSLRARGVILCISPWNFPLAIFLGQIAAALVTGNTVVAKPAEQTSLVALTILNLMYKAGFPKSCLHLVLGTGPYLGPCLLKAQAIAGVMFTGSCATAKSINMSLASRPGPIVPLIAETGGMNAMIVDTSALPEQVVASVVESAFASAGQRCSALRVLYLPRETAGVLIELLQGAIAELKVGLPNKLATDIGPIIDNKALARLHQHLSNLESKFELLATAKAEPEHKLGNYFQPCMYKINSINDLSHEVFGPILHVIVYDELDEALSEINSTGYGLTLGIQSRVASHIDYITQQLKVGNIYVNRNMVGAVVGVQPFGGLGLSGTGPKAGGPNYLARLLLEVTTTVNTSAIGGNAELLTSL